MWVALLICRSMSSAHAGAWVSGEAIVVVCMGRLRARSREEVGLERAFVLFGVDPSPVMYSRLRRLGSPGGLEFTVSVFPVSSLL